MISPTVLCRLTASVTRASAAGLRRVALPLSPKSQPRCPRLNLPSQFITHRNYATAQSQSTDSTTATSEAKVPARKASRITASNQSTTRKPGRPPKTDAQTKSKGESKGESKKTLKKQSKTEPKTKPKKTAAKGDRPKKALTEAQKEQRAAKQSRDDIRKLRKQALEEPARKPETAWTVFFTQNLIKGLRAASQLKDIAPKFRSLSPSELEVS